MRVECRSKRTLLLLGGSRQQVVAIEKAKKCGYRTVLCDYLPDNPGQYEADSFYPVSTTDRDAVLEIARKENVDGVVAYASDPAAPTAAYVAEVLGLPTNPLLAVETMSVKDLFREHLAKAGLPCPKAASFKVGVSDKEVELLVTDFTWPIVVKPTDSSGSKGVSVVSSPDQLAGAIDYAKSFSRNGILIAEEFIEASFPHVVGGDIFVVDGEVRFWGLMDCLRNEDSALVPVGEMIPSGLSDLQYNNVKDVLQRLVLSLDIQFGELNVEVIIGKGDIPYVLELGARAGGNMIPVQLSDVSGIDLVAANVRCAMGDEPGDLVWESSSKGGCAYSTYVVHSNADGFFGGLKISDEMSACVYRTVMYVQTGDPIKRFDGANKALGILFMRFDHEDQMSAMLSEVNDHIKVEVV